MLLGGPISHTSTQYVDFFDSFAFQFTFLTIILLILVDVEHPLCVVVILS